MKPRLISLSFVLACIPTLAFAHGEEVIFVLGGELVAVITIAAIAIFTRLRTPERILFVVLPLIVTYAYNILPGVDAFIAAHFGRRHATPFIAAGLLPPAITAAIVYGLGRKKESTGHP